MYYDITVHIFALLMNFQCVVTVNDNGYPNNNVATANVVIFVTRDVSLPVFTNNARYTVTINENEPVGDGIITVSASRQGLLVSTNYIVEKASGVSIQTLVTVFLR